MLGPDIMTCSCPHYLKETLLPQHPRFAQNAIGRAEEGSMADDRPSPMMIPTTHSSRPGPLLMPTIVERGLGRGNVILDASRGYLWR